MTPYSRSAKTDVDPSNYLSFPPPDDDGALAGPSKRRKGSPDVIIPPTKCLRRVSQPRATENTGAQPDAMDEDRGFVDTNLSSEVQKTMRALVRKVRLLEFFKTHALEPNINTEDARTLMQVARPELLKDYIKEKGSVYTLFIKVEGKNASAFGVAISSAASPKELSVISG